MPAHDIRFSNVSLISAEKSRVTKPITIRLRARVLLRHLRSVGAHANHGIPSFISLKASQTERMSHSTPLERIIDVDTLDTIAESPVAYVSRALLLTEHTGDQDCSRLVVAIKSASIVREFSKQPHDIVKEARLLARISHPNIIDFLGYTYEMERSSIHFWMPFVPSSLYELLSSPAFSPHLSPVAGPSLQDGAFSMVVRSIIHQILTALAYLHDSAQAIAHRDIKPRNVLISPGGLVKLIDFGISWNEEASTASDALWPEPRDDMCPHICSGPYRAPETIFGPTDYDPFAVDLWSFGAVCAEFFTPIRFAQDDPFDDEYYDDNLDVDDDKTEPLRPHIVPDDFLPKSGSWSRDSLFNADKGSIGLAWSIFKVRGTPNDQNWPSFNSLPDANKVTFIDAVPVDLGTLLPNLPPSSAPIHTTSPAHFPPEEVAPSPLDLVNRFLVYPPERRLRAEDALKHPWLSNDVLLLPEGYTTATGVSTWQGRTLGDLVRSYMLAASDDHERSEAK